MLPKRPSYPKLQTSGLYWRRYRVWVCLMLSRLPGHESKTGTPVTEVGNYKTKKQLKLLWNTWRNDCLL